MEKNSFCVCGFFHDYEILEQNKDGLVEICRKCKDKKFFRNDTPDFIYLSYHLKLSLQLNSKRYLKHYGGQLN